MFKFVATKIAHNTTLPAFAGNSNLRLLQDLITAEKSVLMSLHKLGLDLTKAGDALRIWGQGEGDDLGDILTASSTIIALFTSALTTYSSLHHTIRTSMKSVRTREEALEELRRRRRRVDASAEAAQKKLNKMSPQHKNFGLQTDTIKKLRDEVQALDGDIMRQEAELGDYKRKCVSEWLVFKFGGLVECCEKGVTVGDIGMNIIQSIPDNITQPGFARAYYDGHGRVGNLVVEAQNAISQVTFPGIPSGATPAPLSPHPPSTTQDPPSQPPFLPTPSLGSELTSGVSSPPGPPPVNRRASVDELGTHVPREHATPQYSTLPLSKERDPRQVSSMAAARSLSLSTPHDGGVAPTEENQSWMASSADALSQSHRAFSLEEATSLGHPATDDPLPKYESIGPVGRSTQSESYTSVPSSPFSNLSLGNRGRPSNRLSTESIPDRLPTPTAIVPPFVAEGGVTTPRSTSPMYRSPLEYPCPTPPFSPLLMARSTSLLTGAGGSGSPGAAPRMISATAFRRQQARSMSDAGTADTNPLTVRRSSGLPSGGHSKHPFTSGESETDAEMQIQVSLTEQRTVIVLDTNILLDLLSIIQTFVSEVEDRQLPVMIIIPKAVIDELDAQKKKSGRLSWGARQASTWLLKKTKERKSVRSQAVDETCRSPGDRKITERTNDASILDCCRYFSRQGRTILCSKDKLLGVEAESVGIPTLVPGPNQAFGRDLLEAIARAA